MCCPTPSAICLCDDPSKSLLFTGWTARFEVVISDHCRSRLTAFQKDPEGASLERGLHDVIHEISGRSRRPIRSLGATLGTEYFPYSSSEDEFHQAHLSYENRSDLKHRQVQDEMPSRRTPQSVNSASKTHAATSFPSLGHRRVVGPGATVNRPTIQFRILNANQSQGSPESQSQLPSGRLAARDTIPPTASEPLVAHWNPRRRLRKISPSFVAICGPNNVAAYGGCFASTYKRLEVTHLPGAYASAIMTYPGLPFTLVIDKLDAYNQTIVTDSVSVLQVYSALLSDNGNINISGDPVQTVSGTAIARMEAGRAVFTISVKVLIAKVDSTRGITQLARNPMVYFEGTDAETAAGPLQGQMRSDFLTILAPSGEAICPRGSILSLDAPGASTGMARLGGCAFCGSGSYSVSPLASSTNNASNPSCVPCPLQALQRGDCELGGSEVHFSLGTWSVSGGLYRLVACPSGYQLVNSVDGVFTNQAQRCQQCGENAYIADSSNPAYACQTCPSFLVCNGTHVQPLLPGSVIVLDVPTGVYLLVGCPPGYALQARAQSCQACAALFYCLGGNIPQIACPANTFSPKLANSSHDCISASFVYFTAVLQIAVQYFDAESQRRYIVSVAAAVRTTSDRVVIQSIASVARRTAAQSLGIEVSTSVAASDAAQAKTIAAALEDGALVPELAANGLPYGTVQAVTLGDGVQAGGVGISAGGTAGLSVAAVVILGLLWYLGSRVWLRSRRNESLEEQTIRLQVSALRQRLGLTNQEGFYLSSEAIPIWRSRTRTVIVLRTEIEAAARLGLAQDFDLKRFDSFCHCVEYSASVLRNSDYSDLSSRPPPFSNGTESSKQYVALCDWLLDVCRLLIEPEILQHRNGSTSYGIAVGYFNDGYDNSTDINELGAEARDNKAEAARAKFLFFRRRVCRARIWLENRRRLWYRLKKLALDYMNEIAPVCNSRFAALCAEHGARELLGFGGPLAGPQELQLRRTKSLGQLAKELESKSKSTSREGTASR